MFIPDKISLHEVLPRDFYKEMYPIHGEKLWILFDDRLLQVAHYLRQKYGTVYINNWYWGGNNQWRGWRTMDCPVGAALSQHKFWRALDMLFKNHEAEEIRRDILAHKNEHPFKYISGLEMKVSWLHIDTGNRIRHQGDIQLIYPYKGGAS